MVALFICNKSHMDTWLDQIHIILRREEQKFCMNIQTPDSLPASSSLPFPWIIWDVSTVCVHTVFYMFLCHADALLA